MFFWLIVSLASLVIGVVLMLRGVKKLLGEITFKNPRLEAPSPEAMAEGNILPVPKIDVGFEVLDDAALVEVKDDILSLLRLSKCRIRVISSIISIITVVLSTIILLTQIKGIVKRANFKAKHPRLANNPRFPVFTFEKTITIVICFINFILSYNNTKYYANDIQKQDDCSDGSEAVNENFDVIKTNIIIILVGLAIFLLLGVCKFPIVGDIIGSFTGFCIF